MQGVVERLGGEEWGREGEEWRVMGVGRRADQGWDRGSIRGSGACQNPNPLPGFGPLGACRLPPSLSAPGG